MVVIAGSLKGRSIPFDHRRFGGAETTPQRLKGAVFSMLGDDLTGSFFLDLYACSGQMGLEALSRNAQLVVMNEQDGRRFSHFSGIMREWGVESGVRLLRMDARECVRHLAKQDLRFDAVYLDPPYDKQRGEVRLYDGILDALDATKIVKETGLVFVQHYAQNILPDGRGSLRLIDTRKYGTNAVSLYHIR